MTKTKSPLATVKTSLLQIRESARVYREALLNNEAATRAVLIDPLLRVLGWDTGNPFMVEVERRLNQSRFDYTLLDRNRQAQIVIEAKSAGTDLAQNDTHMALVKYAFDLRLENIFLTDGVSWHHYTQFKPGFTEPERKFSIDEDNLYDMSVYLVQHLDASKFWEDENIDQISQETRQLRGEVNELKADFARFLTSASEKTKEDLISTYLPAQNDFNNDFSPLSKLGDLKHTKPQLLRLPDNSIIKVGSWTDVLVQSCDYVLSKVWDLPIPLPDKAGKRVQLLSSVQPPLGISYYQRNYNGRQIFIYTNYDSANCVKNSLHILSKLDNLDVEPAITFA